MRKLSLIPGIGGTLQDDQVMYLVACVKTSFQRIGFGSFKHLCTHRVKK